MNSDQIKSKDKEYILGTYARQDLCIEKGKGAVCYTFDGKKYIDFASGIGVNALGFSDDGWVQAVTAQASTLQHTSNLFYTEPCVKLAEMLVTRTHMSKMFFANSGAEANEGAIKAARKYSHEKYGGERFDIVTLENSFHGRTMATITATGQDGYHKFFDPFLKGFSYAKANDVADLNEKITNKTCAILVEFVQGEGGVVPLNKDFVDEISRICTEKDILFIADEVQTGIGRTGTLMAYEQYGVKPDIVTVAKGLGAGLPIGGILFGDRCDAALVAGDHGSTFGGNPVACAGGVEVLTRITDDFLKDVKEKALYMVKKLGEMPGVDSVHGLGLMLGIEINGKKAADVMAECTRTGLLVLTAKDRVRLLPPLVITYEEIDEGLAILEKAIGM